MTRRKHFYEGIRYELTPIERIRFTDPVARQLRNSADLAGDHLIDLAEWTREGLLALATCYPVLISRSPRSSGMYQVIANGALLPALRLRHPEISAVPTLLCTTMDEQDRVLVAGSEMLGLSTLFRHRENQVEAMVSMYLAMQRAGVNPLVATTQATMERALRLNARTLATALSSVSKRAAPPGPAPVDPEEDQP